MWAVGEETGCGERLWDKHPQLQPGRRLLAATTALPSGVLLDPRAMALPPEQQRGSATARPFSADTSCRVTL